MKRLLCSLVVAMMIPLTSEAGSITFTGTDGGTRSASVVFDNNTAGYLTVTLTNTSLFDSDVPTDLLTAVFFNLTAGATVAATPTSSAILNTGSSVVYDPQGQPAGGVVGGEWAYKDGLNQYSATSGISSTGVGLFGPADLFPGPDLESPASPDGPQYGILSAGWVPAGDNTGLTGSGGLIENSVVFKLAVTSGILTGVTNVTFQYGTDLSEPHFPGTPGGPTLFETPVPDNGMTIVFLGVGLLAMGLAARRMQLS
jgi:hypothetical protein